MSQRTPPDRGPEPPAGRPSARVRVTAPPAQRRTAQRRTGDLDQSTRLGGVYLASLLREQLWLAARTLTGLVLVVGALPLVFYLAPGLSRVSVHGLPVVWLALGVGVYPVLVLLGWRYVVAAERTEHYFAELMSEIES